MRRQLSQNFPNTHIYAVPSLVPWYYILYKSVLWHLSPTLQADPWDSSHLFSFFTPDSFSPTNVARHHLPALKSLMTCPLMELCRRSDVTQNLPQSLFPVTMLQAEYILPRLPHCPLHFLPKPRGSRFNFCIDLVQKKRAKKSDQRSTKSFPLNQSKYMNKLLVP